MSSFDLNDLPAWAKEMLEHARVARLALVDDRDHPRALPVTFALHDNFLWSIVDRKPKRVPGRELARLRYLRRRPEAAVIVDQYDDDWSTLAWLQLLGRVAIIDAAHEPPAIAALAKKYAPYRENPPEGPLLRLAPERAIWWRARG